MKLRLIPFRRRPSVDNSVEAVESDERPPSGDDTKRDDLFDMYPDLDKIRVLTVQQPWATAIFMSGKDVENRSAGLGTAYRGPLLIHAGSRWSARGENDPRIQPIDPATHAYYIGGILGLVDVVDAHKAVPGTRCGCTSVWADTPVEKAVVHLILANWRAFNKPVDCPGTLGLWSLDRVPGLRARVEARIDQTQFYWRQLSDQRRGIL